MKIVDFWGIYDIIINHKWPSMIKKLDL